VNSLQQASVLAFSQAALVWLEHYTDRPNAILANHLAFKLQFRTSKDRPRENCKISEPTDDIFSDVSALAERG